MQNYDTKEAADPLSKKIKKRKKEGSRFHLWKKDLSDHEISWMESRYRSYRGRYYPTSLGSPKSPGWSFPRAFREEILGKCAACNDDSPSPTLQIEREKDPESGSVASSPSLHYRSCGQTKDDDGSSHRSDASSFRNDERRKIIVQSRPSSVMMYKNDVPEEWKSHFQFYFDLVGRSVNGSIPSENN